MLIFVDGWMFFRPPEVHYVVFMVSSVQVHGVGVKQKIGEQQDDHLHGLFPAVHKVPVEHVWRVRGGEAILKNNSNKKTTHGDTLRLCFALL